ncbi:MAG: hypothetical protein QMD11_10485 [Smithella sp.]|nr:hypothetical protein [Smithella sp.]
MERKDSSIRKDNVSEKNEKKIETDMFDMDPWRCEACGHIDYGYETSGGCPYCFCPDNAFEKLQRRHNTSIMHV